MNAAAGLAIAGDGSALPGAEGDPGAVLAALSSDARSLRDHTSLNAFPVAVAARDAGDLSAAVRALPTGITAVFLARTEAARARAAQRDLAGGVPIITEQDTLGVALAASVLVALRRKDIPCRSGRVVVTGAEAAPLLVPLLMAAGVGDIASWRPADAPGFPLAAITRDAAAVVDLTCATGSRTIAEDPAPAVIVPDDPFAHLLALPGLVRALRERPDSRRHADPLYQLEVYRAGAQALAALAPVDRVLPELSDPDLTRRVADAAAAALSGPRPR
ncbi:hypothetical protein ACFWY9_32430 [Amycolatopsis sp. NPDC059027]|uniref:hypothetical protein n=1 Tax=unclassified Amycolatopsis TaxID=2618356 RepID=UPI00366E7384